LKFVFLILHGAADAPLAELDGKTPLEAARTPRLDEMAQRGRVGVVWTLPAEGEPRSELALLGLLGYPPAEIDTPGAGSIEAAGIDLDLDHGDLAFRVQLVDTDAERLLDPAPRELPAAVGRELLETVARKLNSRRLQLYPGSGRTHILVWREAPGELLCTSPYAAVDQPLAAQLPRGEGEERLRQWMFDSFEILAEHRINRRRVDDGRVPARMLWPWSPGRRIALTAFSLRQSIGGVAIAGTDLVRGAGRLAGLRPLEAPGATGDLDTDYGAKARAALFALRECSFALIHVQAPGLAALRGDYEAKVDAIERVDERLIDTLLESLGKLDDFRLLVVPDHVASTERRQIEAGPVPFLLAGSADRPVGRRLPFDERAIEDAQVTRDEPWRLLELLWGA
jgi:2,3-bisphosphoglycerate-independent phosphoglycerate mutase